MTTIDTTLNTVNDIYIEVLTSYGQKSRPTGAIYCLVVLETAKNIIENVAPSELTDDFLNCLTINNMHTARTGCEIAIELLRKEGVLL